MPSSERERDTTRVATLANGVRVVAAPMALETASVSVFVRTGSAHESARLNGVSHFVEHMAFKGTHERDCQRINLDAERLGAEVNAHTDKDHTAYHMRGLARDAGRFVHMLGDIVRHGTFPEAELERERQVILHEFTEDAEDPQSTAYKLFDQASFGAHALAQPVIGTRANIRRLSREELLEYVQRQYTGTNVVVAAAGAIDAERLLADVEAAFGDMPAGAPNEVAPPAWRGGVRSRSQAGSSQTQLVLGFPIPGLRDESPAATVAAALFGEGMSSPLLDQLRERRGLVYHAACSADVLDGAGQFVVEAATAPRQIEACLAEVSRLLRAHAETVAPLDLERARNQIAVRTLRATERPWRRLEDAALDLFVRGRVRGRDERLTQLDAVDADAVREVFAAMLRAGAAVATAGALVRGAGERFADELARAAR